jgi:pimeloyl-ACP methyl ester carboxylesterase
MLPIAKFLVAARYDVLAIDLRAHGESEGAYPSPGYLEVAEVIAAVDHVHRRSPGPVILLGHSLGSVAVLHAAGRGVDVAAAVADSAFVSSFDMMDGLRAGETARLTRIGLRFASSRRLAGLMTFMMRVGGGQGIDARRADLMPVLPGIRCPVLFVTGERDDIALTANTRRMAAAVTAAGTRVAELHAGHQTHADAPREYERAVLAFLDEVVATR